MRLLISSYVVYQGLTPFGSRNNFINLISAALTNKCTQLLLGSQCFKQRYTLYVSDLIGSSSASTLLFYKTITKQYLTSCVCGRIDGILLCRYVQRRELLHWDSF